MRAIQIKLGLALVLAGLLAATVFLRGSDGRPASAGILPTLPLTLTLTVPLLETPTPEDTPAPTDTLTPTDTPGETPTPPGTPMDTPPPTDTATDTPVPTDTLTPTDTPTRTATRTPTNTSTPTPTLRGDADCSGGVNSVDAALVLQYTAGLVLALPCRQNASVDGNDEVSSIDATLILQYGAGLVRRLPPDIDFEGTLVVVRGLEADCLALDTGADRWVLWEPSGLSAGQRVRIIGFLDPLATYCGIVPVLRNNVVIPIN